MFDAILFDLMGTVVYDPYLEAIAAATGMSPDATFKVRDRQCWPDFERGAIDEAEFVRRFFPDPQAGQVFDIAAFNQARRSGYDFLPGVEQLLGDLQGVTARYVASNYPVWIEELRTTFRLERYFEGFYASCYLGVRKPERAFFDAILDDLDLAASRCLFVDDRLSNCEAAASLGMAVHHFEHATGLRARLVRDGLLTA
jgi:FMN hydrolase / 5-amino-6-(5-phospho-D-ribitylamino)uracil phosphatase